MSDSTAQAKLIAALADDLRPVRPLRPPMLRAAAWVAVVAMVALVLSQVANLHAVRERLLAEPDMWLAVAGSALTAILAAAAAFETSVPGRGGARWAWLPLPALLLWLGASGLGCLRAWALPAAHDPSMPEERHCLYFIVGVSVPLSLLMLAMLRQACPLRPGLTTALAGLSAAGASATLLAFFHPFDPTGTDLAVHALAVCIVIGLNRLLGGGFLGRR